LVEIFEARQHKSLLYRFFAPKVAEGKKYPLILSLHGAGGKGNDNLKNLKPWNGNISTDAFQAKYPCYIVVPQSDQPWKVPGTMPDISAEEIATYSKTWQKIVTGRPSIAGKATGGKLGLVFELLDTLALDLPIDPDRVYVLGHSMGGAGTYESLAMQPNRFAAGVPCAGLLAPWRDPALFKHVPVWAFHGDRDTTVPYPVSVELFDKVKQAGGNMKLTTLGEVGHGSAGYAFSYQGDKTNPKFSTSTSGPHCDPTEDIWAWLFAQRRAVSE
jgi:predicted peptidase